VRKKKFTGEWYTIGAKWHLHQGFGVMTAQERRGNHMVTKSMGHLLVIALLMGGLLVPGHAQAVTVNQLAPDFTLPSTTGDTISLSQFRGKKMVLLEFYGINFGTT
jgi:hypothetical protein